MSQGNPGKLGKGFMYYDSTECIFPGSNFCSVSNLKSYNIIKDSGYNRFCPGNFAKLSELVLLRATLKGYF